MKHHDVLRVHEAGLRILERTGVVYQDDEAVELLRARGCRVEGRRVWLPPKVVEAAVESTPQSFVLRGRSPGRDLVFGAGMVVAASAGAAFVVEGSTVRSGTLADLQTGLRLMHGSRNVDMVGVAIEPRDLPEERRYRTALFHCLTMTDKPVLYADGAAVGAAGRSGHGGDHVGRRLAPRTAGPDGGEQHVAAAVRRGHVPSDRRLRPVGPTALHHAVRHGGDHRTGDLAGILALQHAEALAGITLSQAANEGAPLIYGGTSSITSMVTGDLLMGVPQYWTLMARRPSRSPGICACRAGPGEGSPTRTCPTCRPVSRRRWGWGRWPGPACTS